MQQIVAVAHSDNAPSRRVLEKSASGTRDSGLVIVCRYLDSVSSFDDGPAAPAPGADDNASGAAALLEIGRVLGATAPHELAYRLLDAVIKVRS